MRNMHKKLNVFLVVATLLIAFLLFQISNMTYLAWRQNARQELIDLTSIQSSMLTVSLRDFSNALHTFADNVEILRKRGVADRELAISMARRVLLSHYNIFGVNLAYEPQEYDGKDDEYRNHPIYLADGVFMPYIWKKGYEMPVEWSYTDGNRQWYDDIKSKPRVFWSEPVEYEIGGANRRLLSLFVPIMETGRFLGVAAADYQVSFFADFLDRANIARANGFIFTESGAEVISKLQLGRQFDRAFLEKEGIFEKVLRAGKAGNNSVFYIDNGFLNDFMVIASPTRAVSSADNNLIVCYVVRDPSVMDIGANLDMRASIYVVALIAILLLLPLVFRLLMRYGLDPLTQAYTREMIERELPAAIRTARKNNENLSIIMADLDYFKKVNDIYGHQAGDKVLREFVAILKHNVRMSDWVARYGGEEFLLCCLGAGGEKCEAIAERIRKDVEDTVFKHGETEIRITVSMGIASVSDLISAGAGELIALADKNLYAAKSAGRNRVIKNWQYILHGQE